MKITDLKVLRANRSVFCRIYTDEGIVGLGESGAWGFLEASAAALETMKEYLLGKDPLEIEHHWQYLYRFSHFRGAAVMGALSAIDIALWDIAGKYFHVPVYKLLGGKCRIRCGSTTILPAAPRRSWWRTPSRAWKRDIRPWAI